MLTLKPSQKTHTHNLDRFQKTRKTETISKVGNVYFRNGKISIITGKHYFARKVESVCYFSIDKNVVLIEVFFSVFYSMGR